MLLRPELLDAIGVSRVAHVDGLDRLGLPTVVVHRPLGSSLSSHQGKGIDHDLATISALMEALECDRAERFARVDRVASLQQLRSERLPVLVPEDLPGPRLFSTADGVEETLPRDWIAFEDLAEGSDHLVPASLVRIDFDTDQQQRRLEARWLPPNTNGIAAGNSESEASLHALCEVVERHAMAAPAAMIAMDPGGTSDPLVSLLARHLDDANIEVRLQLRLGRTRNDKPFVRIPTYLCLLIDHGPRSVRRPTSFGSGSHPSPRVAILRAITEAVQARTSLVAGARDDILPDTYERASLARPDQPDPERIESRHIQPIDITPTNTRRLLKSCITRLSEAGFERVLGTSLESPEKNLAATIPVRRIVIPGMHFDPGVQRLRASLQ
ncbi:MAG: YcaO-like family protein [Phycisphaera sp.]|nr:YcaO-like family protein [Phycisphaera sp.]